MTPWINLLALVPLFVLALAGCASGPREKDLLPDTGPTTLEVYERHLSGAPAAGRPNPSGPAAEPDPTPAVPVIPARWSGETIAPTAGADSQRASEALAELQRDFQEVHNPEILGYVYPHLAGDLPVPGYYTAFRLREGARYAAPGEGVYPGVEP